MNKVWPFLIVLTGCVKPQQSALQSTGVDFWTEMERHALEAQRENLNGTVEVQGTGDTALSTVQGTNMDLALLLRELTNRANLSYVYDLCEPIGKVSIDLQSIPLSTALPLIVEQAGYRCTKRGAGQQAMWVIADGGPAPSPTASYAKTYRQFTPTQMPVSTLKEHLLLGSVTSPALWPQGNTTGVTVGMSSESNRLFLTGPQADVARTLQILQKADQQTPHILLDCVMIFLKEIEAQSLYAKLDFSKGPLFLTGLGNNLDISSNTAAGATGGAINASVFGAMDQPLTISSSTNPTSNASDLKALLENIENRQFVRAQLLVQSGQQASLQIGRNGYLLLTTFSEGQPSVQSQIINAGSTLQLTPKALPNGMIRVDANLQVGRFEETAAVKLKANTLSFKTVNTLQVRNGEPVLLSGGVICYRVRSNQGYPVARQLPVLDFVGGAQFDQLQDFHLLYLLRPQIVSPALVPQGIQKSISIPLLDGAPGVNNLGTFEGG